ncbi:MATE family efflux transporter [Lacticaseibacillus jixiensis]|uniref:MATE family efflux transporter n=1 Tax=Lacticaseibacillus jixiensis TaxID=3231926 RepID=UPI0036F39193
MSKPTLWHLSWPILLDMLLQTGINNANVLLMAQYSATAVGAVAAANQLLGLAPFIYGFVAVGTQILASQLIGAKRQQAVSSLVATAFAAAVALGVLVSALAIVGAGYFLSLIGLRGAMLEAGTTYLQYGGFGVACAALSNTVLALLRSYGHTRAAILVPLLTNGITLCGSFLSVHNPWVAQQWGVAGLGWGMLCGNLCGLACALWLTGKLLHYTPSDCHWRKWSLAQLKAILRLGLPSSGEALSYQGAQVLVLALVASLGVTALITKSYLNAISQLLTLAAFAFAQGNQIIVGRLIGAGQVQVVKRTALVTTGKMVLLTAGICSLALLFSAPLLHCYTHDAQVLLLARRILIAEAVLDCIRTVNIVLVDALNAVGDVRTPFLYSLVVMWAISIPFAYVLAVPAGFGLIGIWLAYIIDEGLRGILMLRRWQSGKWQDLAVTA